MKQETQPTKKYQLTITVDEEQLIKSYVGNDESIDITQLPDTDALILFSMSWVSVDGIHVVEIEEMEE